MPVSPRPPLPSRSMVHALPQSLERLQPSLKLSQLPLHLLLLAALSVLTAPLPGHLPPIPSWSLKERPLPTRMALPVSQNSSSRPLTSASTQLSSSVSVKTTVVLPLTLLWLMTTTSPFAATLPILETSELVL